MCGRARRRLQKWWVSPSVQHLLFWGRGIHPPPCCMPVAERVPVCIDADIRNVAVSFQRIFDLYDRAGEGWVWCFEFVNTGPPPWCFCVCGEIVDSLIIMVPMACDSSAFSGVPSRRDVRLQTGRAFPYDLT